MKILIIQNVQAPSLPVQVQESPLCSLLSNASLLANFTCPTGKKKTVSVISTHNNIVFQNMFALKQYRSS